MLMNNYFKLTKEQQQRVLQAAENKIGLPAQAIEKDIWVTTLLQIVFNLPFAADLTFKGGTSISKVWGLINRFSEDIDLAIDPARFGLKGDLTKKQIKKLRKSSSLFVKDEFYPELNEAIKTYGLDGLCTAEAEPNGEGDNTYPEPRKIWVRYESALPTELDYLKPIVMLEISARSLMEPYETTKVQSMAEKEFLNIATTLIDSDVHTAVAGKTFLEKAFLIHELFSIEGHGEKANRKSRHLYDLAMMMDKDFAREAVKDDQLWETIRHHREIFTSVKGMDYTPDIRKRIVLVPREDIFAAWEKDYLDMQSSMIYGEKPTFEAITEKMKELERLFKEEPKDEKEATGAATEQSPEA